MNSIAIVGEIVAASVALAGLILVYLGAVASSYEKYAPHERKAVRQQYSTKAWGAFAGIVLALMSCAAGFLGKWIPLEWLADVAAVLLLFSFAWAAFIAYLTASEIK